MPVPMIQSMADNGDGQDAYDTPDRESPTPSQNDDMSQNRSRGGPESDPPARQPAEIETEDQVRGYMADEGENQTDEQER